MASVSRPQIMSCTPIWTILARLVKPILMPTCVSPRSYAARIDAVWIA